MSLLAMMGIQLGVGVLSRIVSGGDGEASFNTLTNQLLEIAGSANAALGAAATNAFTNQFGAMKMILGVQEANLTWQLTQFDDIYAAEGDAEVQAQVNKYKRQLSVLVTAKTVALNDLEYATAINEANSLLLEQANSILNMILVYGANMSKDELIYELNAYISAFVQLDAARREAMNAIMAEREAALEKLLINYLHLNDMSAADREQALIQLEMEKARYQDEINMLLYQMDQEDEFFMWLMQMKHYWLEGAVERVDSVYIHDTNASTEQLAIGLGAMNQATYDRMVAELQYQAELNSLQMSLLANQMRLDQERQMAEMQAETTVAKLEIAGVTYTEILELQNETNEYIADLADQKMRTNAIVKLALANTVTEARVEVKTTPDTPTDIPEPTTTTTPLAVHVAARSVDPFQESATPNSGRMLEVPSSDVRLLASGLTLMVTLLF